VGLGGPAALVQLLVGAVAEVGVAVRDQGIDGGVVAIQALGLHVRPVGATLEVALVPVQPQPAQPVHDPGGAVGQVALGVGVLDPQHELAVVASREQVRVKGGPRSADMQEAGWRRGKPGANGIAHAPNATRVRLDAVLSGKVGAPQLHPLRPWHRRTPNGEEASVSASEDASKHLRVAVVAPPWFPIPPDGYGGIEAMFYWLVEGLVARGHQVTLIGAGDCRTSAQGFLQTYEEPPVADLGTPFPEIVHALQVDEHLRSLDVDVVHDHSDRKSTR